MKLKGTWFTFFCVRCQKKWEFLDQFGDGNILFDCSTCGKPIKGIKKRERTNL